MILSDVLDELWRDVVDVDDACLYLGSEFGVVGVVPPFRFFRETDGSAFSHFVCIVVVVGAK